MVADIVEETELRTGRRSEGLLLAAYTFLQKLSAGMAIAVPGLLLGPFGRTPTRRHWIQRSCGGLP
jgi:GPH family glycoside/pentoside/hexuronide:cation symporter